jgi:RimJ/RimL family protein N-acetyltransferase
MARALRRYGRGVKIARLTVDDAEALRDLRREALLKHPTAFSADPDIESRLTLDDWRQRLSSRVWFGGNRDGVLCGMIAYSTEASKKTRHTAFVGSMYVRESERGGGMADALMAAFLEHAAQNVEQVMLNVEAGNERAIRFYERNGFRTVGRMPRSILVDGSYYDELAMYRSVANPQTVIPGERGEA